MVVENVESESELVSDTAQSAKLVGKFERKSRGFPTAHLSELTLVFIHLLQQL